ncbi:MAG: MBL fold metallo-hydrolase [Gemmatimonadales bacterium]
MIVTVLGSGTVAPTAERTAPAHWVTTGGLKLLLDCGPGTLHRAAALEIPWWDVTHIAITHFHPDHWSELPAFVFALRWGVEPARSDPLTLIAPRGMRERISHLATAFGDWVAEPEFALEIIELSAGDRVELSSEVVLESCKTPHTDESLAYAVRSHTGRVVYTGDTGPSAELAEWARDCDLLLAECSLPDERALDLHLTPATAGELARRSNTRHLVLTHFYPVFGDADPARLAREHFAGRVSAAHDGSRFRIGEQ